MRVSSHWGSREALDCTPAIPDVVAEFQGDASVDQGRWRHAVRVYRLRRDLSPSAVPSPSMTPKPPEHTQARPGGGDGTKQPKTKYHVTPVSVHFTREVAGRAQERSQEAVRQYATQRQAIDPAREQARQHPPARVIVHRRNGSIRAEYTYGNERSRTRR
ncbi:DUF2188 domain-containing protein [Actinacidiphila glaucinigra]|uniref:DUF2188 domain-containing protein n=1 Tax=Actinacidiphila glaucinigra TaxID=235986 RepID=UPI0036808D6A